jgi:hypothetical protein
LPTNITCSHIDDAVDTPTESIGIAVAAKPGDFFSWRSAKRGSCMSDETRSAHRLSTAMRCGIERALL